MKKTQLMLVTSLLALGLAFLADLSAAPPESEVAIELEKLQGLWKLTLPDESFRQWLTIEKGKRFYRFYLGNSHGALEGSISVDPTTKPKSCEFRYKENEKEIVVPGIYDLDGDSLRICTVEPGKPRPAAFPTKTKVPGESVLYVFKRYKERH